MHDRLLIVNTCHLSSETTLYLACTDCLQWPMVGGPFQDMGWFFHVDDDVAADPEEPFADLYHAMEHAAAHRYSHILFYDIGEVREGLPIYREPELEELDGIFYSGSRASPLRSSYSSRHFPSAKPLVASDSETPEIFTAQLAMPVQDYEDSRTKEAPAPYLPWRRLTFADGLQAQDVAAPLQSDAAHTDAASGSEAI